MKKIQVSVHLWVYFCMNYPSIDEVLEWVCKKAGKTYLYEHCKNKFYHLYDVVGSHGVMNTFYCDCDQDIRDALVEYAMTVWAPVGMKSTLEKNKDILGL